MDLAGPVLSGGSHPVVLLVASPGLAPQAYEPLGRALQAQGLDAWMVAPPAHGPGGFVDTVLPEAISDTGAQALVGEGIGGRLVAEYLASGAELEAVALLGPCLELDQVALSTWLADQPLPSGGLDLPQLSSATWRDREILPLLLGTPLPPLQSISAGWLEALKTWLDGRAVVALPEHDTPVWVGMASLDVLAPPERIRAHAASAKVVRFGPTRLDARDFDHADLLGRPRPVEHLAQWLASQLDQAAEEASP